MIVSMNTNTIIKLYEKNINLAQQLLGKRVTERIQELLKVVEAEGFCEEGAISVSSGMGTAFISCDNYKARDESDDTIEVESNCSNDLLEEIREDSARYLKPIGTNKAIEALREIGEICDYLVNENLTCVVGPFIYSNEVRR